MVLERGCNDNVRKIWYILYKEDGAMKKAVLRKIISIFAAMTMALGCAMTACAHDTDHGYVKLSYKNAPEGTVYIDILVPIVWDTDFLTEPHEYTVRKSEAFYEQVAGTGVYDMYGGYKKPEWKHIKSTSHNIVIGKDSEIVQYCKDGFVSLFGRTSMVRGDIKVRDTYENGELDSRSFYIYLCGSDQLSSRTQEEKEVDIFYLRDRFSDMKAAYIDENGNVLGVTDKFSVDTHDDSYCLRAEGNELTLGFWGYDYWYDLDFLIAFGLPLLFALAVIILIIILVKWIVQGVRSSKE